VFVRVRQKRVFSPPIGFSERIAAVIRRRVAHIVSFVVLFSLSLSLSLFATSFKNKRLSLSLSLSLSFSLSSFPLALFRVGQRQKRFLLLCVLFAVFEGEISPPKTVVI